MSDTTQTSHSGGGNSRRRFFWGAATATVIAGLATGIGTRAFAYGGGICGWLLDQASRRRIVNLDG